MTRIKGDWINAPHAQKLCHVLTQAGYQVFFVGGCVRNDLLGVPISDLDLCTDARPETVVELTEQAGMRPVPTGIDHGTITVVVDHEGLEVTTFRKDVETDGRRAVVAFSDQIEDDARRRDFTMNALYAAPDGVIHDPLGGLVDLQARRVRFIDDATARIREDYLRTLRFFRFHAWYGDAAAGIDPEGLAACAANLAGLETLSRERVGSEMLKLLAAPDPGPALASMAQSGVLNAILTGADVTQIPVLVHLEAQRPINPMRRLVAMGGENTGELLRLSKAQAKELSELRDGMGNMLPPSELAFRLGADRARDIMLLRATQMGMPLDPSLEDDIALGADAQFPVKPADLMPDLTGPALGARLKQLEAQWIASNFVLTREDLLK